MSTELVVKSSMLPVQRMDDLIGIGQMIAQSGMFGIRNPAEGFIVAATCHQQRISLMEFKETYHIIQGTPSKRADSMLAQFIELGGEYEVVSRTPDKAEIKARFRSAAGTFSLTWEEAQKEPFVYVGKESDVVAMLAAGKIPPIKAKYSTPRARMQMLWARVVSDGVRTVCPQANKGTYTPEEVEDWVPPQPAAPITPEEAAARAAAMAAPVAMAVLTADMCPVGGPEWVGKPWADFDTATLESAFASPAPEITDDHRERIAIILESREAKN